MRRTALLPVAVVSLLLAAGVAAAAPGHLEGYVPAAARVQGKLGSFWTTDMWIYEQGATVIHLWFNRSDADNSNVDSVVVHLNGPVTQLTDVVGSLFATQGVGSIHYLADGPVTVTSRTWTTAENGGSYGQTIAGVPVDRASAPGDGQAGSLRMLVDQLPDFRSNLGLVNVSGVPVTVAVDIFTADGSAAPGASSFQVDLKPYGMTQIGDVLARLGPGTRHGLVIRSAVSSADGAILAYLSTADNRTNDPSYQEAFRFGF